MTFLHWHHNSSNFVSRTNKLDVRCMRLSAPTLAEGEFKALSLPFTENLDLIIIDTEHFNFV